MPSETLHTIVQKHCNMATFTLYDIDQNECGMAMTFSSDIDEATAISEAEAWKSENVNESNRVVINGQTYEVSNSTILIEGGLWIFIYILLWVL